MDRLSVPGAERQKNAPKKNVCGKCGADLQDDQKFCQKCGQKVGLSVDAGVNAAINQFNAGVEKNKKSKKFPIIIAIIMAIVSIVGLFVYKSVQELKTAEAIAQYKEDAASFRTEVLSSGITMEDIGKEIHTSWKAYVYNYKYNGKRYYSVDSAIEAAQSYMVSSIVLVKKSEDTIETLYNSLLTIPDTSDQELLEVKHAVKDVYVAYIDMYDCVISPSGNFNSWTSEFNNIDQELSDALDDLDALVD